MFFVLDFIVHYLLHVSAPIGAETLLRTVGLRKSISGYTRNRMQNPTITLLFGINIMYISFLHFQNPGEARLYLPYLHKDPCFCVATSCTQGI
jgi:hypothetical protein